MKYIRKIIFVLLLWIAFSLGCFLAPFLALVLPFYHKNIYTKNFIKAADRMTAAMLGFSGQLLLSTEVLNYNKLRWLHLILNELEPNHCEDSAFGEGAYCRISDKKMGIK